MLEKRKKKETISEKPVTFLEGYPWPAVTGQGFERVRNFLPWPWPSIPLPANPWGFSNRWRSLAPTPEAGAPKNANIVILPSPDQAGRWAALLILDPTVKKTVVSIVVSRFKDQLSSYIRLVESAIARAM